MYEASRFKKLVTEPNCKTKSTRQTDFFRLTKLEARLVAKVVEPTPPLLDETAMIFPRSTERVV